MRLICSNILTQCFCSLVLLTIWATVIQMVSGEEEFNPRRVVGEFDPIVTPDTVDVAAAEKWIRDEELVIGVVIGEVARAYPINMLTNPSREIINDELGDRSIAATW